MPHIKHTWLTIRLNVSSVRPTNLLKCSHCHIRKLETLKINDRDLRFLLALFDLENEQKLPNRSDSVKDMNEN